MKKRTDNRSAAANEMTNRTGVLAAPQLAKQLQEGAKKFSPAADFSQELSTRIRAAYIQEGISIGSRPPADDMETAVLLDKLGARLAFERSGVRLYDAVIRKRAV